MPAKSESKPSQVSMFRGRASRSPFRLVSATRSTARLRKKYALSSGSHLTAPIAHSSLSVWLKKMVRLELNNPQRSSQCFHQPLDSGCFNFTLVHVPAEEFKRPDGLSRRERTDNAGDIPDEDAEDWIDDVVLGSTIWVASSPKPWQHRFRLTRISHNCVRLTSERYS